MEYLYREAMPAIYSFHVSDSGVVTNQYIESLQEKYNSVITDDTLAQYIPIVNFASNLNPKLMLENTLNVSKSIHTGVKKNNIKTTGTANLPYSVEESFWDLLVSDTILVLNFSKRNIYIKDKSEKVRVFKPFECEGLSFLNGQILFITINIYDNIDYVKQLVGVEDYLSLSLNSGVTTDNINARFTDLVHKNIAEQIKKGFVKLEENGKKCSYKICGIYSMDIAELINGISKEANPHTAYLDYFDLIVSLKSYSDIPLHPKTKSPGYRTREELEIALNEGVICYIVDKNSLLGDRYTITFGNPVKIPVIRFSSRDDGLYYTVRNKDGVTNTKRYKLEEIDKLDFIYKTEEEARTGLNAREITLRQQEQEDRKREEQRLKEKHELDMKALEEKLNKDLQLKEADLRIREADLNKIIEQKQLETKLMYDKRQAELEILNKEREHDIKLKDMELSKLTTTVKTEKIKSTIAAVTAVVSLAAVVIKAVT